jgi:hypothetical protein
MHVIVAPDSSWMVCDAMKEKLEYRRIDKNYPFFIVLFLLKIIFFSWPPTLLYTYLYLLDDMVFSHFADVVFDSMVCGAAIVCSQQGAKGRSALILIQIEVWVI